MKLAREEERERRRVEMDKKKKRKKQEEEIVTKKSKEEDMVEQQRVSTLDMPHYDLGQTTTESSDGIVPLPRAINDMFQVN